MKACLAGVRFLLAGVLLSSAAIAAIGSKPMPSPLSERRALTEDEQAINKLLLAYHQAYDAEDARAMRGMVADGIQFTQLESGSLDAGWREYLADHLQLEFKAFDKTRFEVGLISADIADDQAYVVYRAKLTATIGAQTQSVEMLGTALTSKMNGYWFIRHIHTSSPPKKGSDALDIAVHKMEHPIRDVAGAVSMPAIKLSVERDGMAGWNVHVKTENFALVPEKTGQPYLIGEGHIHLYVNGEKVARMYGNWFHLGDLPKGKHTIRATLNGSDHSRLVNAGVEIASEVEVEQPY